MRLLVRTLVVALLATIGLALGPVSGSLADPPERGKAFDADIKQIGAAADFSWDAWPNTYGEYWMKPHWAEPKTAKDIWYFQFTAGASDKVDRLREKFPLEVGRLQPRRVDHSMKTLWRALSQAGEYLHRKHPGLETGTSRIDWRHNEMELFITHRAPKVSRYVERRWKGAVNVIVKSGGPVRSSVSRTTATASDFQQTTEAEAYGRENWPGEFAGIWRRSRDAKPKTEKVIYFVGFTSGAARHVEELTRMFPLESGEYQAVKVARSEKELLKVLSRLPKFLRKKNVDAKEYTLSFEAPRNAIGVEFTDPDPKIRRALKKRFGRAVVVIRPG